MNYSEEETDLNQEQLTEISELSKRGYQLLKESLTDRAVENFKKIVSIQPDNNYALVGIGDAYRKDRRYNDAVGFYQDCLRFHPGNNYALFGLADCYKALNQFNRAIDIWEEYLKHDDKNVTVLTRIADAYRKVRNFPRSKELYLRVLEMENQNSYALIGLGHLHYDFKEYEGALKYWKMMEEQVGNRVDIRVLTSIGNCYRKLKTFEGGVPYFERALEMQPANFYALFGLADCYRGMNQPEQSLLFWNRILARDPQNKVILTRAGDAYRVLEQNEKAVSYYREALAIEYDLYAVLGLALIAKTEGNYEEALGNLSDLMEKEQKNHRLYIEAAECYENLGRKDDAIEILNTFLNLGISNDRISEYVRRLQA